MSNGKAGNGESGEKVERLVDMLIPNYILDKAPETAEDTRIPSCPVLVFVNGKSGGQLGAQIIPHFRALLDPRQVHELPKEKPAEVLREFLEHLEKLMAGGDKVAEGIRRGLRLVVAGGDGTHGWILGAVANLKLHTIPPVATIPLGTGNNLPFSFGWGKHNPPPTVTAVRELLLKAVEGKPMPIDKWHVLLRMSKAVEDSPLEEILSSRQGSTRSLMQIPSFNRVSESSEHFQEGLHSYEGSFWNYLSLGMDAQVSHGFHSLRQEHPERFKNQFLNQCRYAGLTCTQGWFCATCTHPKSKNIKSLATISIAKYDGAWHQLDISPSIRAIVMLNLPSFSGGLNPWGDPSNTKSTKRGLTFPYVNDGLIEVVGFRDGWHGMSLLLPKGHGTRLAQAHKVKVEFHKGRIDHTYIRVDGEPWVQHLPNEESDLPTVMEISHQGQAVVLAYGDVVARKFPSESPLPFSRASIDSLHETD